MLNKIQLLKYVKNLKAVKINLDFFSVSNMSTSQVEKISSTRNTDLKSVQTSDKSNMETDKNKKDILNEFTTSVNKDLDGIIVQRNIKVQADNDVNESKDGKKFELPNSDSDNINLNEANSGLNIVKITNSRESKETEITTQTIELSICPTQDSNKTSKHQSPIIIKKRLNYFGKLVSNYYLLFNAKFEPNIRAAKQLPR